MLGLQAYASTPDLLRMLEIKLKSCASNATFYQLSYLCGSPHYLSLLMTGFFIFIFYFIYIDLETKLMSSHLESKYFAKWASFALKKIFFF